MKQKSLFAGTLATALAFTVVLVGCDNAVLAGLLAGSNATYVAMANGEAGVTTSTRINLTFSVAVAGLTAGNISVSSGTGSAAAGALTGSGTEWSIALTNIAIQGNVSVSIYKTGIDGAVKTVAVYKQEGNPADTAAAAAYRTTQAAALALTVNTVAIANKDAVNTALAAYSGLTDAVKALLTSEKAQLDVLLAKIADLETAGSASAADLAAAAAYRTGQAAAALALTVNTVAIANKDAVDTALAAYNGLSDAVKALLTSEKALLDGLSAKIAALEAADATINQQAAAAFTSGQAAALALTVYTVAIANKGIVEAALDAYNDLSAAVKALLPADTGTRLQALLDKIAALETAGGGTLAEQLAWISSYAVDGGDYTIELKANEAIAPAALSYSGKTVTVTLKGDTAERTVSLGSTGSLFTVGSGVTLILDNNVTLQGRSDNTASLVYVNSGGTLEMKGTAKITGNTASSTSSSSYAASWGGGVYVYGSFTMSGIATVSGNTASSTSTSLSSYAASSGGGVYVGAGSFTMNDNATVSGNTASSSTSFDSYAAPSGGGVYVGAGSFTMNDNATVSGNITSHNSPGAASSGGGGVFVDSGSFTMNGSATVSGNTNSSSTYISPSGGGVYVGAGSFTMSDSATVSGNTASGYGGGVFVYNGSSFTMSGSATVSGNTASSYGGGGVYVSDGGSSFTMSDSATVSGNTAPGGGGGVLVCGMSNFTMNGNASVSGNESSYGGGVYLDVGGYSSDIGIFTKTGGIIYGSNETNPALRNTVKDNGVELTDQGAAVYEAGTQRRRETTVTAAQNLTATVSWDGSSYQYTFTGQWDD